MKNIVIFLILISTLIPTTVATQEDPLLIRIGYSPEKLFNSDIGVPSFIQNEDLWIHPNKQINVKLIDPIGNIAINSKIDTHPSLIYKFQNNDHIGTWELNINDKYSYSIELSEQSLSKINHNEEFHLINNTVSINGVFETNFKEIPTSTEVIINKKRQSGLFEVPTSTSIDGNNIRLQISHSQKQNGVEIYVYPFLDVEEQQVEVGESLNIENQNIFVWAEITSEVSLIKNSGKSRFITYIDEEITKTARINLPIVNIPSSSLNISLPSLGKSNNPWTIPLKYGRAELSIYLEHDGKLGVERIPIIIIPEKLIINPDRIIQLSAFEKSLLYNTELEISNDLEIEFVLITKINGIDKLLYFSKSPSISKIFVHNRLTNERLNNYELVFSEFIEKAKLNEITYILTQTNKISVNILINSFQVEKSSYEPKLLEIEQNKDVIITTAAGMANIRIFDALGLIEENGEIVISRADNNNLEEQLVVNWTGNEIQVLLPQGKYLATVDINNVKGIIEFQVEQSENQVDIMLNSFYGISTNIWIFILSTIITIELGFAFMVWKKALNN
ncbi:MAG: hypothetical protein CMO11_03810 [Thaumarchaeota archaeon]|nr:hypothetical protein [Nitrososphaerota archaeon]